MSTATTPTSTLGAVAGSNDPGNAAAPIAPAPQRSVDTSNDLQEFQQSQQQPTSRLHAIISAVSTALSGIPDRGRPSFVTGLGEGSRAAQAAQAYQDEIRFKNFDQQVRLTQLHRQDLAQQQASDDLKAAQKNAQDFQKEMFDDKNNLKYDSHPNSGDAVVQTLKAQTAANGAADIPPGTHLNSDGSTINIPSNDPQTLAAQVQKYKALQGVIPFLPSLPAFDPNTVKSQQDVDNARADLGKHLDIMTNLLEGHNVSGGPWKHEELNNLIPSIQAQRDSLAKSGTASAYQLGTLDRLLEVYKAQEGMHTDAETKAEALKKKTDLDVENANQSPQQKATLQHTQLENKKLAQDIQNANAGGTTADDFGNPITPRPGGAKVANATANSFKKNADSLAQTEQTYQQFQSVLSDINAGKDITGAQSVVSLFNAIGLSAEPLKGKGFRINNNTVEEHANATGLDQKAVKSFASLQNGEVITPQQIKDYAQIALDTRKNAYITNYNEAKAMGINPSFLLPKGNGQKIDPSTASIFLHLAGGDPAKARAAAQKSGWGF